MMVWSKSILVYLKEDGIKSTPAKPGVWSFAVPWLD